MFPTDPIRPVHPADAPGPPVALPADPVPCHDALTGGGTLARITLHARVYALRITRAGTLILTK